MKRENRKRVDEINAVLDEIEDIQTALTTKTSDLMKGEPNILSLRFQLMGHGNTNGDKLRQKFNGVYGVASPLRDTKEYKEIESKVTKELIDSYSSLLEDYKVKLEAELETL